MEDDGYTDEREERPETIGLLVDWNHEGVSIFVEHINAKLVTLSKAEILALPKWIIHPMLDHFKKTDEAKLMSGIVAFLKEAGSRESFGNVLIASLSLVQYTKVISAVCHIENDAFMQDVMKVARAAPKGNRRGGLYLASLALISSKTKVYGQPIDKLKLSQNNIQLFKSPDDY